MGRKPQQVTIDARALKELIAAAAKGGLDVDGISGEPVRLTIDPDSVDKKWADVEKKCPKCKFEGQVAKYFGVTRHRGIERPQSWCADCRSKTNYHARTRVNDLAKYHALAHNVVVESIKPKRKKPAKTH